MSKIYLRLVDDDKLAIIKINDDKSVEAVKSLTFEKISDGTEDSFLFPYALQEQFQVYLYTDKGENNNG